MRRHGFIYFSCQFDESGVEVVLLGLPTEIEGIDWNAVTAKAGARIERMKAEGFCGCGVDYFPDIDSHSQGKQLELIHQRDVDAAINILEQFRHLCHTRRRHWYRTGEYAFV